MDDKVFDQQTAREWMDIIESENARVRENDIYPRIRNWIARNLPAQVLEVGCGQGACAQAVDVFGVNYVGVDPSSFLVLRAKELYGSEVRKFLEGSAYDLPFERGTFDAAFSVAVWHLLSDIEKATQEIARALKSGGHFLLITANPSEYPTWIGRYPEGKLHGTRFEGITRHPDGSETRDVLHLHPHEKLLAAILSSGLEVNKTETFRGNILIEGRKE